MGQRVGTARSPHRSEAALLPRSTTTAPVLHMHEVDQYVERADQPFKWCELDRAADQLLRTARNPEVGSSHIVAGVHNDRATFGFQTDETAGRGVVHMQCIGTLRVQCRPHWTHAPRNSFARVFRTLQLELLDEHRLESRQQLALAVFEWIEAWYNPKRRHSYCKMLSPVDYEAAHAA